MAKTGHPNFTIKVKSPWRGMIHQWSVASSHSGASFTTGATQLAFMVGVWNQSIGNFLSAEHIGISYVSAVDYYNGIDSAALYSAEYASSAASVTAGFDQTGIYGNAYASAVGISGLEVCVVLEAPVGLSKTGKPVTLKKFIHAVPGGGSAATDSPPLGSGAVGYAQALGNGALPGSRVLISASGKQGTWAANAYFGAHQMPRRRKKSSP